MFSKTDGPTALRAELIQALSFSHDRIERVSGEATVASLAAVAGVWNGRKGHVALIVRDIEPAAIERYVGSVTILSEIELEAAVEEGIAFAESLGFSMDAPEFLMLSPGAREERVYRWNKLRKLRPTAPAPAAPLDPDLGPRTEPVQEFEMAGDAQLPSGYEIELKDLEPPSPSATPELDGAMLVRASEPDLGADSGSRNPSASSAVLGRISLVRKDGADARRLELLARLLASY